jgi:hypothetical protein
MKTSRRSLCIVSRDPWIVGVRGTCSTRSPGHPGPVSVERRHNPDVDLAVRTKGFAIVPAVPMTSRPREEPDAEERVRFENSLSFKRRHESPSGRVVGAAGAAMVALILAPPPSGS